MRAAEERVVGPLRFKNRIVVAPFKSARGEPEGVIGDAAVEIAATFAEGGAAMVITEPMAVLVSGREHPRQLAIHDDAHVDGLQRLVRAIHSRASIACCHLNHAGRAANPKATGGPSVAPSAVPCPTTGQTPEPLTEEGITAILAGYEEAAARAWWAGYDAIEIQMGHGYLVAQFLSPRTNARTDRWGGSVDGRLRFARDVLAAVRRGCHGELPLIVRISGSEEVADGLAPAALGPLLRLLEAEGVAMLHVGMGSACDTPPWYYGHMALPMAPQEEALAAIQGMMDLPLIAAGRMGEPGRMERVLDGLADLVALARPLIADPDLPRKIVQGRADEIVLCGACLQGCLMRVKQDRPIGCIVNPAAGRTVHLEPAARPLRIMVAGGGPAGMTAAVTLAERGHTVALYEREPVLGGQFRAAPAAPGKQRMALPLESLIRKVERSPVRLHTGSTVTAELIARERPDAVVVATGAAPVRPPIPGLETVRSLSGVEFFAHCPEVEGPVLVIGGGLVGMEAAELLAERGLEVTVVELLDGIARDMEPITRTLLLRRLETLPVTIHTSTAVRAISPDGVVLEAEDGRRIELPPVETVIYSVGTRAENALADAVGGLGIPVHVVGDAVEPNQIIGAVESAWELARSL